MKNALFIFSLLVLQTVSQAQEKRDTMEISVAIRPTDNSVSVEVHIRPWGNPGLSYFELNDKQYGLRSFSGQEDFTTYAFSVSSLTENTLYVLKMFATNDKGQIINTRDFKFKTRPKAKNSSSKKRR